MEGVNYDIRDMLDAMVSGGAPDFDMVRLTGGIFRSELWCQMQADIFNRSCEVVAVEEATALGCAMVAAVGVGIYKDFEEAEKHMVKIRRRYEPNPENVKRYEDAFRTVSYTHLDVYKRQIFRCALRPCTRPTRLPGPSRAQRPF